MKQKKNSIVNETRTNTMILMCKIEENSMCDLTVHFSPFPSNDSIALRVIKKKIRFRTYFLFRAYNITYVPFLSRTNSINAP